MATIVEDQGADAIDFERELSGGADPVNYWRLVGLEVTTMSTSPQGGDPTCPYRTPSNAPIPNQLHNCASSVLINTAHTLLGTPDTTNNLTFDRVYVHGSPTQDAVEGVSLNCLSCAIVDSYISDIHLSNADSQAAIANYTPGPIKVHNSYLASTGEALFFGGGGATYTGGVFYDNPYVVSDIEVTQNTIGMEPAWYACGDGGTVEPCEYVGNTQCPGTNPYSLQVCGNANAPNNQWEVKNDLEFKTAQRALVSGNQLQNSWESGQLGANVMFEPAAGQGGNASQVVDINFENNIISGGDSCLGYTGIDYDCSFPAAGNGYSGATNCLRTQRVNFYNNLCLMAPTTNGGAHYGMNWVEWGSEAVFNHNTVLMSDGSFPGASEYFQAQGYGCLSSTQANSPQFNLYSINNLLGNNPAGDCGVFGTPVGTTLGYYQPGPSTLQTSGRLTGNVIWVPSSAAEYDWNTGPLTGNAAVTNVSYGACGSPSIGNYQLASPNWAAYTTDGAQAGVICSALCAAGACSSSGTLTILSTSPPNGSVGVAYLSITHKLSTDDSSQFDVR
jgi:hypothetical protein